MSIRCVVSAIAMSFVCVISCAQADIFAIDNEFGQNAGTVDSAQGLEFLDLTLTTNMSYDQILPMLGSGGAFEGWRHATYFEVNTLVNNAGIQVDFNPGEYYSTPNLVHQEFVELIGANWDYRFADIGYGSMGFTQETLDNGEQSTFAVIVFEQLENYGAVFSHQSRPLSEQFTDTGHWLVRENTIPAPSSLSMLAIIGYTTSRRRR